jgi:hypothetical protein
LKRAASYALSNSLAQGRDRWPPIRIVVTSGKRLIEVTDLPDGSMFFVKPYSLVDIADSIARLVAEFTSGELRVPR